jgi:murein DD-endopeptidase MepM/ murein hydrolase activator NlpD
MIKRLCAWLGTALLSLFIVAAVRAETWLTYRDTTAGFAFDYPAGAQLSLAPASSPDSTVLLVSLPAEGSSRPAYTATVFANPDDLPLPRFLTERRGFTSFGGQNLRVNDISVLRAAAGTALAGDEAEVYWLPGAGVVVRLGLSVGRERSIGPPAAARAAFDRAVSTFHLIPRESATPIAPEIVPQPDRHELLDEFTSPYGVISTTTAYGTQWNIVTNDTRYGVRNLSLPGAPRKCWNVTWPRMLHSGIDLYRLDGQDAAGTPLVAVADGTVAYYRPSEKE